MEAIMRFDLSVVRAHKGQPADLLWETVEYADSVSEAVAKVSRNIPDDAMVVQSAYLKQRRAA